MRHRVACLDVWSTAVRALVRQSAPADFELHFADSYDTTEQMALAGPAAFIVAGFAPVDAAMMAHATGLRLIHKWGVGYDRIDLDAARLRGVGLAITTGANAAPVAELAIGLMLGVYRRLPYVNRAMREGRWPNPEMRETCFQIAGKTIGLVGFGHIGRMLARRLRGFDARIIYCDLQRADAATETALAATYTPLQQLLACSDIVSLHAPLTVQTRLMINTASIAAMKDGAVLINTARGELVDEDALYQALLSGKLRGAGLDAFDPEPPRSDNPLLQLDQVVLTPHSGGGVFDNVANVARHVFDNLQRLLRGEAIPAADLILPPVQRTSV